MGHELLRNPKIEAAVSELMAARSNRTEITADRVLAELAKIGFANMYDFIRTTEDGDAYVDLSNLTREQAAAISEITVEDFKDGRGEDARDVRRIKIKLADKKGPLIEIGKHLGMFRTGKPGEGDDPAALAKQGEIENEQRRDHLEEMAQRYLPKPKAKVA